MVRSLAPVGSNHSRVGVRAIRITTESHVVHRITIPIPCAYTSNGPNGLAAPQLAHVTRAVVPSGAGYVSDEKYLTALNADRQELRRRLASSAFGQADALLFPTTPCAAPRIENQWMFQVGGKDVTDI